MLDEIVDPMPYEWWVTAVGVTLLVLTAAAVVAGVMLTREPARRKAEPEPEPERVPPPVDPLAVVRVETLRRLDDLEQRHAGGQLDDKALHLALRSELRTFAHARTGRDVSTATVATLAESFEMRRLATELEHTLAPTFAARSRHGVAVSLKRARRLVRRW